MAATSSKSPHTSSKALLAGIAGAAIAFVIIAIVVLAAVWSKLQQPGDPSGGGAASWGLVAFASALIPVDLVASVVIGVAIFATLYRRR